MEELELQERPGLLGRFFGRKEEAYIDDEDGTYSVASIVGKPNYSYRVTIRRQILTQDDMFDAANGLRRGEMQVLNLTMTEPSLRQKVVDFMNGVRFAHDAHWEEVGEHIYMIAPASTYVEAALTTARTSNLYH